jgi:hypothetical protein
MRAHSLETPNRNDVTMTTTGLARTRIMTLLLAAISLSQGLQHRCRLGVPVTGRPSAPSSVIAVLTTDPNPLSIVARLTLMVSPRALRAGVSIMSSRVPSTGTTRALGLVGAPGPRLLLRAARRLSKPLKLVMGSVEGVSPSALARGL